MVLPPSLPSPSFFGSVDDSAITAASDPVVLISLHGEILLLNAPAGTLLGASDPRDLVGRDAYALFSPALSERLKARLAQFVSAAIPSHSPLEGNLVTSQKAETVVEISAEHGSWQNALAVKLLLRNVTERHLREDQQIRAQRLEMIGQLSGRLVHDLNNVLTAIRSSVGLVEADDPEKLQVHLRNIDDQAHRGASLLRQVMLFTRGADDGVRLVMTSEIIGEAATVLQATFGPKYPIELTLSDDLPDIQADSTLVHQLITILCLNGRDAMPAGGTLRLEGKRVTVTPENAVLLSPDALPGDYAVLKVSDGGAGIDPALQTRLFEPYFTTKLAGKASGMGLATVDRIMRRHSGFVTAESKPGAGACFACFFPAAPASASWID